MWSTGQDQCAVIKRSIQHLLPAVSVFLDVDDLEEIGKLESYIDGSASVLIFLSKGYFASRNCIREAKQTVAKKIPIVLVHEADPAKGGLTLEQSRAECPVLLRDGVFTVRVDNVFVQNVEVISWLRVREFQLLSLRMICYQMLRASPHYRALEAGHAPVDLEAATAMSTSCGHGLFERMDKVSRYGKAKDKAKVYKEKAKAGAKAGAAAYKETAMAAKDMAVAAASPMRAARKEKEKAEQQAERERKVSYDKGKPKANPNGLSGLYVPGELLSLGLSCTHQAEPTPLTCSSHNPGAWAVGKEVVRAVTGITLLRDSPDTNAEASLLDVFGKRRGSKRLSRSSRGSRRGSVGAILENLVTSARRTSENLVSLEKRAVDNLDHALHDHALHLPRGSSSTGSSGGSSRNSNEAQPQKRRLLLLLNSQTWLGEEGEALAELVRWTRSADDDEIVMVHENDPARGGCEFGHLFSTTPPDLLDDGIYSSIAIALHAPPHRAVSLAQVAQACGALPTRNQNSTGVKSGGTKDARASQAKHRHKHRERQAEELAKFAEEEEEGLEEGGEGGISQPSRRPSREVMSTVPPSAPGLARGISTSQMACCLSRQGSEEPSGALEAPLTLTLTLPSTLTPTPTLPLPLTPTLTLTLTRRAVQLRQRPAPVAAQHGHGSLAG